MDAAGVERGKRFVDLGCGSGGARPVAEQFMDENGRIVIQPNFFKYVVATV